MDISCDTSMSRESKTDETMRKSFSQSVQTPITKTRIGKLTEGTVGKTDGQQDNHRSTLDNGKPRPTRAFTTHAGMLLLVGHKIRGLDSNSARVCGTTVSPNTK